MRLSLRILALVIAVYLTPTRARAMPTDFEGWLTTTALLPLEESQTYQFYLELQPRVGDDWKRMALLVVRPAFVYNVLPHLALYGGYAWVPKFYNTSYHREYRDEQRIWQQAVFRHDGFRLSWVHRLRQEQRKIAETDGVSNRTRYLLRGSYPLEGVLVSGITAYDEFMVNLNGVAGGPRGGFDQNRIFIGPYWESASSRYEVGYLGELDRRFGDEPRWVNAIAVLASFSF